MTRVINIFKRADQVDSTLKASAADRRVMTGEAGEELVPRDLHSHLVTYQGGTVAHGTHKPTCLFDSSMGGENNASCVLAEKISYAREVARAIGDPQQTPTRIYSDNDAHVKVAMKKGSSARSKHLLRRYYVLMQRVKNEEVTIVHVPDAENPADFLTKFVPAKKFRASMRYVTQSSGPKGIPKRPRSQKA